MNDFRKLAPHIGHRTEVVGYGVREPVNVAVECLDCGEVLVDADWVPSESTMEIVKAGRKAFTRPRWKGNAAV